MRTPKASRAGTRWLWLAAAVAVASAAHAATRTNLPFACEPARLAGSPRSAASPAASRNGGLDLEIRVGPVRIEFPWLRLLPITPGRRIVVTVEPWGEPGA